MALLLLLAPGAAERGQALVPPRDVRARELSTGVVQDGRTRVIVQVDPGVHAAVYDPRDAIDAAQAQLMDALAGHNVEVVAALESLPLMVLQVDAAALDALEQSSLAVSVEADTLAWPTLIGSVPHIGAPTVWNWGYDGNGQTVVVLDTGIDNNHPFVAGNLVDEACFSTSVPGLTTSLCPNGSTSQFGPGAADALTPACIVNGQLRCAHGTHVAGIAAGAATGSVTFNGVAPGANLIAIQIFTRVDDANICAPAAAPCFGSFTTDQLLALDYVLTTLTPTYAVAAVNMSLGAGLYSSQTQCDNDNPGIEAAIGALRNVGIATVIAAGNDGSRNGLSQPACVSSAVAVSSVYDPSDIISSFSNMHAMVELMAPGQGIISSYPDDTYLSLSGTSMSAPHVAGAWALLKQLQPAATVDAILNAFIATGVPIVDTRSGGSVTKPRIQVDAALALLNNGVGTDISLTPRVILQGAYDPVAQRMRDDLRTLADFPLTSPYGGSESTTLVRLADGDIDSAVVDWALLELRSPITPSLVIAQQAVLVQRDGQVVDAATGTAPVVFANMLAGDYYVAIRHRNHLGVMTANPVTIDAGAPVVDFTALGDAGTYGTAAQKELAAGVYGLWAGDTNSDGKVVYAGQDNDKDHIFNGIDQAPDNALKSPSYILNGYRLEDVNLSGEAIFAGQDNDVDLIFNSVDGHPDNLLKSYSFVISEQMP
ncbi:MAG: S8 family serine peptidase [Caldilineaceae bacterium]|nr:S8 family serine peptidase [Caldilineaceae bacterium]